MLPSTYAHLIRYTHLIRTPTCGCFRYSERPPARSRLSLSGRWEPSPLPKEIALSGYRLNDIETRVYFYLYKHIGKLFRFFVNFSERHGEVNSRAFVLNTVFCTMGSENTLLKLSEIIGNHKTSERIYDLIVQWNIPAGARGHILRVTLPDKWRFIDRVGRNRELSLPCDPGRCDLYAEVCWDNNVRGFIEYRGNTLPFDLRTLYSGGSE